MNSRRLVAGGLLAAVAVFALAALLLARADRHADLAVAFGAPRLVAPGGAATTVTGTVPPGVPRGRIAFAIDDVPVAPTWRGRGFEVQLPSLAPGAHVLRAGVGHHGGIRRDVQVPVVAGPFAPAGAWIANAVEISVGSASLDGRSVRERGDFATALCALFRTTLPPHEILGPVRSCTLAVELPARAPAATLTLRGHFGYLHGGATFEVALRVVQRGPNALRLEAARVSAAPDARALWYASRGVRGTLARVAGAIARRDFIARAGRHQAQQQLERQVADYLPRINAALRVPASLDLGALLPGASLALRLAGPPMFSARRGVVLRLDARLRAPAATAAAPGPLQFGPAPPAPADPRRAHVRLAPALLAALVHAYASGDALTARLNAQIRAVPATPNAPIVLRSIQPMAPLLLEPHAGPRAGWSLPDVAVETSRGLEARGLFGLARGTVGVTLARDAHALLLNIRVEQATFSCRARVDSAWRFEPCLAESIGAGLDAAAAINRSLAPTEIRLGRWARPRRLNVLRAFRLTLAPANLTLGPGRAPTLDLALRVRFDEIAPAR